MKKRTVFPEARYKPVEYMHRVSGLPVPFIYKAVKDGWAPHIRMGNAILIHEAKFLERLDELSEKKEV